MLAKMLQHVGKDAETKTRERKKNKERQREREKIKRKRERERKRKSKRCKGPNKTTRNPDPPNRQRRVGWARVP